MPFPRLILLLTASILIMACEAHKTKASLVKRLYQRTETGGHCTRSIYFINDSLFCYEGGCEASSTHYFGRWTKLRDTLSFSADTSLAVNPLVKETVKRIPGDSISVRVLAENGAAIPDFKVAVRRKDGGVRLVPFNESEKVYKCGMLTPGESLRLHSLEKGYRMPFILPTESGNYFEIVVHIPPNMPLNGYSQLIYQNRFSLVQRGDSLVSFGPEWGGEIAVFKLEQ